MQLAMTSRQSTDDDSLADIATAALEAAFGSGDAVSDGSTRPLDDAAPRSTLTRGTVLGGRYEVLGVLGEGGMGKVYEARDRDLGRLVAVKVLTVSGNARFDPEQMFEREARLLAGIQHPNMVAVHEIGRDAGVVYLVMDLVQGQPLGELLRRVRRTLPEGQQPREAGVLREALQLELPAGRTDLLVDSWFAAVARVLLHTARSLQSAHDAGVLHRDLKPANIMLRGDGSPVVLDFGLAAAQEGDSAGVTQGLFGSLAYLAPEQVHQGRVGTDPRTDVYQLGTSLYECLTLRRAFPKGSPTSILDKVSRGDFPRPRQVDPGIPYELEAICLQAMEADPDRRYGSMAAFADDLQRFVDGREQPHAARARFVRQPLRRLRWFARAHRATALTAAALVLGGLLGWALMPDAEAPATGVVTAFRAAADGSELQLADEIDAVRDGDVLGVVVESDEPLHVYALSVYGEPGRAMYVAPLMPAPLDPADEASIVFDDWNLTLRVPAGRTALSCAAIEAGLPGVTREGLWVFTSPETQPVLSGWLRTLDELVARDGQVELGAAREHLDLDALRGANLDGDLTAARHMSARLREAMSARDAAWPLSDPQRTVFSFEVLP